MSFKKIFSLGLAALFLSSHATYAADGVQIFRPVINHSGIMTLHNSSFTDAQRFGIGLNYNLALDPVDDDNGANGDTDNYLNSANLGISWVANQYLHFFADLGLHYWSALGDQEEIISDNSDSNDFSIGNVKLGAQIRLLDAGQRGFGIGLIPWVEFPTAGNNIFLDTSFYRPGNIVNLWQYGANLVFDWVNHHSTNFVVNVGWDHKEYSNWLIWGSGIQQAVSRSANANLFAEVSGRFRIAPNDGDDVTDLVLHDSEALLGYKHYFQNRASHFHLGVGRGLTQEKNFAAPDLRVFAGLNLGFGGPAIGAPVQAAKPVAKAEPEPVQEIVPEPVAAPTIVQKSLKVEKIHFVLNNSAIKKDSLTILDRLATALNNTPGIRRVVIEGHTDSMGDAAYNKMLSNKRAASVLQYLVSKGVSAGRLESRGFGEEQPIADNKTRAGRSENRRVEFKVAEVDPGIDLKVIR